ncbi:biotin--[acetyl-CoA-carboxylase] ligase [Clostridium tertium]|uniref:Bifunctional ligase/repressor BirA n=1 Tax=Clostridium tertium TaxID=1559 RepID=A0A6N3GXE4_9CLOT
MSVKDKTLDVLEKNRGEYISGAELAKELDVSRNAIWKAIKSLQSEGYNITAITNKGYSLSEDTDILSAQSITKYLENKKDFKIEVYKTIGSTNDVVKELALEGKEEGCIIISEEQTKGKGRFGRKFHSPKNSGIYMSILLRPNLMAQDSYLITTSAAVAVAEAIESVSNEEAKIKWVNDIYIDNKKVSGILTEAALDFESGLIQYVVLGIGVNLISPKEGFHEDIKGIATSIFKEEENLPKDIRSLFIAKIIDNFFKYYHSIDDKKFIKEYKKRSLLINKEVNILSSKGDEKAIVLDIDDLCRLRVKLEDGNIKELSSGEVSIRIMED